MATLTEDYVSFETAKLLKEKGFNEPCICYSYSEGMNNYFSKARIIDEANKDASYILLPTLQMAMKWLREMYKLFIEIKLSKNTFLWGYRVSISNGSTSCIHTNNFNKYEQACETAIKYCLENLI